MGPYPFNVELLATDGFGEGGRYVSISVGPDNLTRVQWIVPHQWSHTQIWLSSVGLTKQKTIMWERD